MPELSIEDFKGRYPDLYDKIFKAGQKAERERFEVLREVSGGDNELLVQCFAEGKTEEQTLNLRVERSKRTNAQLRAENKRLKKQHIDPAIKEFCND